MQAIKNYFNGKSDNVIFENKTLSIRNMFSIVVKHEGVCFIYQVSGKFIMYRIINPIQYKHIQQLIGIRDRINEKGTKEYSKYYMKSKEMNERITTWYRKMHNLVFNGEYKQNNLV